MSSHMRAAVSNRYVSALIAEAQSIGPTDWFTKATYRTRYVIGVVVSLPALLVIPVVTIPLSILVALSLGLLAIPLSVLWGPMVGLLLGSSWLWLKAWYLRPLLVVPGIVVAIIARLYISFIPDMGDKFQKIIKMGLCNSWPYSFLVYGLTKQHAAELPLDQ